MDDRYSPHPLVVHIASWLSGKGEDEPKQYARLVNEGRLAQKDNQAVRQTAIDVADDYVAGADFPTCVTFEGYLGGTLNAHGEEWYVFFTDSSCNASFALKATDFYPSPQE